MHQPGDIVDDRYRIDGVLGRGGIGTTYAATEIATRRAVAIKQLSLWHQHDWKVFELFEREVRVLAALSHPAIPRYLGHFQQRSSDAPSFYLVQEIAPGRTLASLIEQGFRPSEAEVRGVGRELLGVLDYLHCLTPPVIHRDVKPENVLRAEDGSLRLVDFGAVRDTYRTLSQGSTIAGTFGYMAPEQFRGHAVPATDQYGLGALLAFLLTRTPPNQLPQRKGRPDFRKYAKVSPGFARFIDQLLDPEPARRFASARQARVALDRCDSLGSSPVLRFALILALSVAVVVPAAAWGALRLWPRLGGASSGALGAHTPWRGPQTTTGRLRLARTLSGHWSAVFSAVFTNDGNRIVSSSNDGSVKLWDASTGEAIRSFAGHRGRVTSVAISADDRRLVTGGADGARIWSLESGALERKIDGHDKEVCSVAISRTGKIATGDYAGKVLVSSSDGALERTLNASGRVLGLAFTPDGAELVSASDPGIITIWNVASGKPVELGRHAKPVSKLALSPDGQTLVSAGDDKVLKVWALAPRLHLRTLEGHRDEVWSVAFAAGGKLIASSGKDGVIKLWDVYTGAGKEHVDANPRGVLGLSFSPDGKRLAAATGAGTIQIYDHREPSWRPPLVTRPVAKTAAKRDPKASEPLRLYFEADELLESGERSDAARNAVGLLRRALALDPKLALGHVGLARAEYRLGYLQRDEYDPESLKRAHAQLDQALALDGRLFEAHLIRGWVFLFQKDYGQAAKALTTAREIAPTDVRAKLLAMSLAVRREQYDDAFLLAKSIVEEHTDRDTLASAYSVLQSVYRQRREWQGVDETYRSLLNLQPQSAWVRGNYANFLSNQRRHDEAIAMAEAALKIMRYPAGELTLADAHAGKAIERIATKTPTHADLEAAERSIDLAFDAHPRSADAHYARGLLALRRNETGAARRDFERALKLEPDHQLAKAALGREE